MEDKRVYDAESAQFIHDIVVEVTEQATINALKFLRKEEKEKEKNMKRERKRGQAMKLYKTKLGRIFNFIKNEGKFEYGSQVQVMKNTSRYEKYDKYVNQYGIVRNIDYSKKEFMIEVRFADGNMYGFNPSELRKIKDKEYFDNYSKYKEIFSQIQ